MISFTGIKANAAQEATLPLSVVQITHHRPSWGEGDTALWGIFGSEARTRQLLRAHHSPDDQRIRQCAFISCLKP